MTIACNVLGGVHCGGVHCYGSTLTNSLKSGDPYLALNFLFDCLWCLRVALSPLSGNIFKVLFYVLGNFSS